MDVPENMAEITRKAGKQWGRPVLRQLPIAATASSSKGGSIANDGAGGGKGDLNLMS
jgi:hypothetical protein